MRGPSFAAFCVSLTKFLTLSDPCFFHLRLTEFHSRPTDHTRCHNTQSALIGLKLFCVL